MSLLSFLERKPGGYVLGAEKRKGEKNANFFKSGCCPGDPREYRNQLTSHLTLVVFSRLLTLQEEKVDLGSPPVNKTEVLLESSKEGAELGIHRGSRISFKMHWFR